MADINSVVIVGRLVRPSEIRYAQNGGAVVRFSMAVNRAKRTADGRWEDEPNYFDCVYFGRSAEAVNPYLEKGRQVAVQGELRQSRWEQDGQTRSRVEIFVNNLSLCQSSSSNGQARATGGFGASQPSQNFSRPQQNPQPAKESVDQGPEDFSDDTIPF